MREIKAVGPLVGRECRGALEMRYGVGDAAEADERLSEIVLRLSIVRVFLDGLLEVVFRRLVVTPRELRAPAPGRVGRGDRLHRRRRLDGWGGSIRRWRRG